MTDPVATSTRPLHPVYIIMGVTGSGKSTVGSKLASRLGIPFYDADDLHTPDSRLKLSSDIPLNDADREPWLASVAEHIEKWSRENGAVLACSALKHSYRSMFRRASPTVKFIFLSGDPAIIASRVQRRSARGEHVVKTHDNILNAQYDDLEIPTSALQVDIDQHPDRITDEIMERIGLANQP